MLRKKLPNTSWTTSSDPRLQTPRENVTDMIIGFFDGSMLTKDELRQVINDALDYAENDDDDPPTDNSVPIAVRVEEVVTQGTLSSCYIHACIAETIVKALGDVEFGRQVFLRSEELAAGIDDFQCLAGSVRRTLNDTAWYKRLRAQAKAMKSLYICTPRHFSFSSLIHPFCKVSPASSLTASLRSDTLKSPIPCP